MSTLAIHGGAPIRRTPFPADHHMGEPEIAAAREVIESGVLSGFLATWREEFYGGPRVRGFERAWAEACGGVAHAVAVNSCTSGLIAAVGAAGVGPGDEVIVPPFTMIASATAALVFNAVPVFADIDPETFCLDPESIRERITPRTRAIVVAHIFGHMADMEAINRIAREHNLVVIEDAAQSPFAMAGNRICGDSDNLVVFSLNYHKHIHTGEGGMVTTNDARLAERVQLIRNHAENVVGAKGVEDLVNMVGFNFRMGEIEAAIGRCQLDRFDALLEKRLANVRYLEDLLSQLPGLTMPVVHEGYRHVYYAHVMTVDEALTGAATGPIAEALRAELPPFALRENEGPSLRAGYVKPIYLQPMYQQMTAYGSVQCPFRCPHYGGSVIYREGLCPETEAVNRRIILHELIRPSMTENDLDDVARAFAKVWEHLPALAGGEAT